MIFGTYWFAAFCCVFFPGYWLCFFSRPLRQVWLLAGCFIFHYHFAGPAGVFPIIVLSLLTFGAALTQRGWLIVAAIVLDVSALAFYKYFHFLTLQVLGWASPGWGALVDQRAGVMLPGAPPLAVSFFIFEMVHYLYDVRKGNPPLRSIVQYASFIFFFPSLVAGPIKRYEKFVPQLHLGLARVSSRQVMAGLLRIARGYFMKIVIADFLTGFIAFYEPHFQELAMFMRWSVFIAMGLRIWFDFSGYSEIAIGLAMMMGIQLPENFNWPYAATNIQDFWHRWHISLSSWIRDYIYIPLGGSRVGLTRKILNGFIAFALCGLWHGPAWHFVFWGLYHGLGLAVCANYRTVSGRAGEAAHLFLERHPFVGWVMTFFFVMTGWLFFFYPVGHALRLLYLLVVKPLQFIIPLAIILASAWLIRQRPLLVGWAGGILPGLPSGSGNLKPGFVFGGVAAGFLACCAIGTYPQQHNIYGKFVRFHEAINPESGFYPTVSQVRVLAEAMLPKDKIAVVIGGDSGFLGLRQNVDEVWTGELQKVLGQPFAVMNLGMPNGPPTVGEVTCGMLSKTHPRLVYAFSEIILGSAAIDGGDPYRYFYWTAYYRGLLNFDPQRAKLAVECRRAEMRTPDGQELQIGAFLDSLVNADDLWTWFGYESVWTVWSDKTAASPFRPRRLYADEHNDPEFPKTNTYLDPRVAKPANYKFRNLVQMDGSTIRADPTGLTPIVNAQMNLVPARIRPETIACIHWFSPWTAYRLSKDELAAQEFCSDQVHAALLADGYHVIEYGKDYPGEEFADGSHLNATGGRRLAHQLAPVILEVAKARGYLNEQP